MGLLSDDEYLAAAYLAYCMCYGEEEEEGDEGMHYSNENNNTTTNDTNDNCNNSSSNNGQRSGTITQDDIEFAAKMCAVPFYIVGCTGLKLAECANKLEGAIIDKIEYGLNLSSDNPILKVAKGVNDIKGSIIGKLEDIFDVPIV